jgi:quercetin dioxygenase-like cupin family protein
MKHQPPGAGRTFRAEDYEKLVIFPPGAFTEPGHELEVVIVPPHTTMRSHYHRERTEVLFVLHGESEVFIGEKRHPSGPGDAFICEPGESHYVRNMSDQDFRILVFKIDLPSEDDTVWKSEDAEP